MRAAEAFVGREFLLSRLVTSVCWARVNDLCSRLIKASLSLSWDDMGNDARCDQRCAGRLEPARRESMNFSTRGQGAVEKASISPCNGEFWDNRGPIEACYLLYELIAIIRNNDGSTLMRELLARGIPRTVPQTNRRHLLRRPS